MASRKMTFTIPSELADRLIRRVAARERSRYVAEALASRLDERDRQLIRACDVANADPDVQTLEQEFDAFEDVIAEPWTNDAATR